jgi:hypothetical protein
MEATFLVGPPIPSVPAASLDLCMPGALAEASILYDFEDDPIEPLPYGSRIADVPPFHVPRSRLTVRRALVARGTELRGCYRWALHRRPELRGELRVRLPIDRWGVVAAPTAEPSTTDGDELSACVVDVLTGMSLDTPSSRDALASARLRFEPEPTAPTSRRAPVRPRRPAARASSYAGSCMRIADEGAPLELGAPEPTLLVRDADPVVPSDGTPHIRVATPELRATPSREHIWQMIRANVGSHRLCYSDALTRDATIAGRVTFAFIATPGGSLTQVTLAESNVSDPELVACLQASLEDVAFHPLFIDRPVGVRWSFALTPLERALVTPLDAGTIDELASNARALLEEGNGAAALDRFETLIDGAPDHVDVCAWDLAAIEAALVAFPMGGARVDRAARRLVDRLSSSHEGDATCADHASTSLLRAAAGAWPLERTDDVLPAAIPELVLESYAWLAPVPEAVPGLSRMRERLGEAQQALTALATE